MFGRVFFRVLVAAVVVFAVVAVADSMAVVNDAFCGTPRSFASCYQPVLVPALVGGGVLAAVTLAIVGAFARRRASLLILLGAGAIGIGAASPVLAVATADDGCNHVTGYLPRVVAPKAEWLAEHDVMEPSGGYQTLAGCFDPDEALADQADAALDAAAETLLQRPLNYAAALLAG